ncbi:hypothetical protein NKG94_18400 [Micromonospora sp. M12]
MDGLRPDPPSTMIRVPPGVVQAPPIPVRPTPTGGVPPSVPSGGRWRRRAAEPDEPVVPRTGNAPAVPRHPVVTVVPRPPSARPTARVAVVSSPTNRSAGRRPAANPRGPSGAASRLASPGWSSTAHRPRPAGDQPRRRQLTDRGSPSSAAAGRPGRARRPGVRSTRCAGPGRGAHRRPPARRTPADPARIRRSVVDPSGRMRRDPPESRPGLSAGAR